MDNKQKITGALRELAFNHGFYRVTVDELAAHVGMSKRTVYRYFKSKEEIIESVMADFLKSGADKLQAALESSSDPLEKIKSALKALSEHIKLIQPVALHDLQKYYPHIWEELDRFRAARIQQVYGSLLSSNDRDRFRQIDPRIFTTAFIASVRAVVNPSFIMDNDLTTEETIQSIFTIFLYGVVKEK